MIRIINKRATGKTSQLLLLAKESHGILVCQTPAYVNELAMRYGITDVKIMSYSEFLAKKNSFSRGTPVFIDEIEMFLKSIYPYVNGYNISDESDWRTV